MLITEEYRELNRQLHECRPDYGIWGHKWNTIVTEIARDCHGNILDYGAGKGTLNVPGRTMIRYDPAVPEWSASPEPAALVVCTDVLEHIEPECIEAVLDDLHRVTLDRLFFVIAKGTAKKDLPDGRNAHLIQQPWTWWKPLIEARFKLLWASVFKHEIRGIAASLANQGLPHA